MDFTKSVSSENQRIQRLIDLGFCAAIIKGFAEEILEILAGKSKPGKDIDIEPFRMAAGFRNRAVCNADIIRI